MPKLNDIHTILLSTASQRENLSLYPLPDPHAKAGARVAKAIATLLSGGLLQERETSATDEIARTEGDISYGLYGCCQSDANSSLHDACRSLSVWLNWQASATPPMRRSVVP